MTRLTMAMSILSISIMVLRNDTAECLSRSPLEKDDFGQDEGWGG